MSLSDFEILCKIGDGAYSIVYKVRRRLDNQIYALKKVSIEKLNEKEQQNALNEVRIMASMSHPNVISYKESFISAEDKSLCLVMEFADSGDLLQKIQNCIKKSVRLAEKFIWSLFVQLVFGLKALHDLGVFHRDLKSANVFLNKDGSVKLGDMNVSKVSKDGFLRTQTGTPYYASPEVWKDLKYDNKSDIWSLGCVLYEAMALKPPFRAPDFEGLFGKVIQGTYEPFPRVYSNGLARTVALLLNPDSEARPSCSEILELEAVKKHIITQKMQSSASALLDPIHLPDELIHLAHSLPHPNYSNFNHSPLKQSQSEKSKLPGIPNAHFKDHLEFHTLIQRSGDRLKRIREIYLSPSNLYLSPKTKKKVRYAGIKNLELRLY
jgi:NIMA (never in mitosis gene a)-related kinase